MGVLRAVFCADSIVSPRTNCLPSSATARSVAATTVRAPSLAIKPGSWLASVGKKCLLMPMAADDKRASTASPLPSKSARPSWSAVRAMAVSVSGTRSSASASRISAKPSALEMGYSLSKLSIAQNGGGLSRTACTQGAACWAALAQSSAPCRAPSRRVTVCASGR